jgi:hypothetical protein
MRRLASLLVPVLALSACSNAYRGSGPDSYRYSSDRWYDAADVPLAARIDQTGTGLAVRLNRPAYVAMFEILPGQGVGLFYPAYSGEQAYFASGFTMLPTHGARRYDSYFTGSGSRYTRGQPRFYLLVASRQPLRSITRFQHSEGAIRSVLGLNAYSTMNYQRVMEDLVQAVVPYQNDQDWTTDVLAVWPRSDYGYYADNGGYRRVYCGDGTVELLPIELASYGCRRQQRPIVVRQPRVATPPPGRGDSSDVTTPTRRRPEPVAGAPAGGGEQGTTGSVAPGRRPRPTPEVADRPEVTGGGEPRAASPRQGAEERRERPRVEAPAREPRAAEPRQEAPRHESPRPEPRQESPRAEPVRSAPPPAPAPPPARSESPRSEPAPRSDPSPSREERSRPAAPPAAG